MLAYSAPLQVHQAIVAKYKAEGGQQRKLIDARKVFSTINQGDSVQWPNEDLKRLAGVKAWESWKPFEGTLDFYTAALSSTHLCFAFVASVFGAACPCFSADFFAYLLHALFRILHNI
jgi:hypothetical protein